MLGGNKVGKVHWVTVSPVTDTRFENRLTVITPEGVRLELAIAGIGSRFAARLFDSLIQMAFIIALYISVIAAAGGLFAVSGSSDAVGAGAMVLFGVVLILVFIVTFLYDLIFELAMGGQTPGKRAVGLRVVDATGAPARPTSILVRNLVRIVDFLPAYYIVGFVTMLATQKTQRLGDLAAHTIVIRERKGNDAQLSQSISSLALTAPRHIVENWDVSAVSADELLLCRQFLARRFSVPPNIRYSLSVDVANRVAPKVSGLPPTCHPEMVIEGIVLAKEMRS
jgi:uncharacterized RDD family membrane protein YckC